MLTKAPIKHFAKVGSGQGAPQRETDFSETGIPFIRAGSLEDLLNGMDENELPKVKEEIAKEYKLKLYKPNTIVFAKSGMSALKGRIYKLKNPCYVVNHLATLELFDKAVADYVVYTLRSFSPVKLIYDNAYPSLKQSVIENFEVPFPKNKEGQLHIANLLSKAENLIAQRRESIRLLDEFLKSSFLEMFGDVAKMKKMKSENLSDYIEFLTSGSRGWAKYYSKTGSKFLRIQNVWKGNLRQDELQYVNAPKTQEAIRTRVQEGDLLITITADLGRTSVVPKDFGEAYINQHIALVRLKKMINPTYAAFYYFMPFGYSAIQKKNKSAVKSGLTFNDIRTLPIIVPPFKLQTQFAQIVEKTEAIKTQYQQSLTELENLYGSLSQKAFKGELTQNETQVNSITPCLVK